MLIGRGADIILIDDPLKPEEGLTGVPAARGSGSFLTRRWREMDSNF